MRAYTDHMAQHSQSANPEKTMKFLLQFPLYILLAALLSGCGKSRREIDQAAALACRFMGETQSTDSEARLQKINAAREEIGEKPFAGTDADIRESLAYELCEVLVKNDSYREKLAEAKRLGWKDISRQWTEEVQSGTLFYYVKTSRLAADNRTSLKLHLTCPLPELNARVYLNLFDSILESSEKTGCSYDFDSTKIPWMESRQHQSGWHKVPRDKYTVTLYSDKFGWISTSDETEEEAF